MTAKMIFGFGRKKSGDDGGDKTTEQPAQIQEQPAAAAQQPPASGGGLFARLKAGLAKTRSGLTEGIANLVLGRKQIDAELLEDIETQLLVADVGVEAAQGIIADLTQRVARKQLTDAEALMAALREDMAAILRPCSRALAVDAERKPFVILMVGVNGVGKTTTIGKLARRLFGDRPAPGQRIVLDPEAAGARPATVVGVVDDLHLRALDTAPRPVLLRPIAQAPPYFATVAVRLQGDAAGFAATLAEAVRGVDPEAAVYWLRSHAQALRMGRTGAELLAQIFTGVGLVALLLAAVGLYGVLAFSVAQRTREIGIRRAIGAGVPGVIALVAWRTGWQVLAGLAIGLALAVPWALALANPVRTAGGPQPLLFVAVAAVVAMVAAVASLAPMRRALRVDPIIALRHE